MEVKKNILDIIKKVGISMTGLATQADLSTTVLTARKDKDISILSALKVCLITNTTIEMIYFGKDLPEKLTLSSTLNFEKRLQEKINYFFRTSDKLIFNMSKKNRDEYNLETTLRNRHLPNIKKIIQLNHLTGYRVDALFGFEKMTGVKKVILKCDTCNKYFYRSIYNHRSNLKAKLKHTFCSKICKQSQVLPVIQYSLDGVMKNKFNGVAEAEQKTGVKTIRASVCRHTVIAGGFVWSYLPLTKQEVIERVATVKDKRGGKRIQRPVYQYGLDGKLIKLHDSPKSATDELAFDNISACALGLHYVSYGYMWSYEPLPIEQMVEKLSRTRSLSKDEKTFYINEIRRNHE